MKQIFSNKINPLGVNSQLTLPTSGAAPKAFTIPPGEYLAASLTTSLNPKNNWFFITDLSNVIEIFNLTTPTMWGNTVFKNNQTSQDVCLYLIGNTSEPSLPISIPPYTKMKYISEGRTYEWHGERNEKENYGWQPISNQVLYPYIERSQPDGFDIPTFTVRGTRKIPTSSSDPLCGPVDCSGVTYYDRLNYVWYFGENAGIDFNPIETGGTPVSIVGSLDSQEGCATMCDGEGTALFYTDGETVYSYDHSVMMNGTGLSSSGTSTQSVIIVPLPENEDQFYIFTTDFNGNPNGFEYSIVDMSLQGGLGMVTTKNIKLISDPLSEKVTACCNANDEDYWVITHTSGDTTFYSYNLTSAGVSGPVTTDIGSVHNTARGYMKTSRDGSKLVSCLYDEDIIDIFDFNITAGTLSNFITLTGITYDVGPYGVEFSSDSSKFYISDGAGDTIYQFDLTYTTSYDIINNRVELPTISGDSMLGPISGTSLGALQMGPDEKIYIADRNKPYLHVIHYPNGEGVQCNLQQQDFILTSTTITGITSEWGLPNVVTCKTLSCDRYVYIIPKSRQNYEFDYCINNVNKVIETFDLSVTGEIYKYDDTEEEFAYASSYTFYMTNEIIEANNTNNIKIPLINLGEGEFITRLYYGYNINTLVGKQLSYRRDTIETYKRGVLYGMYTPSTDWYWVSMYEADEPLFSNTTTDGGKTIGNLVVQTQFTEADRTQYFVQGLSDPIVAFNGAVLAKNIEYSAITSGTSQYIELLFVPEDDQVLTYAYVRDGSPDDLIADLYTVPATVNSGPTGTQADGDRVFWNTTQSKFEFYLLSPPASDIMLSLNGSALAFDIEYTQSESDNRRVIFLQWNYPPHDPVELKVGDIIQAFYTPTAPLIGEVYTNKPIINWYIVGIPTNTLGEFTVEFAAENDKNFDDILYSFTTNYVKTQQAYSIEANLEGVSAGDKLRYRVKNTKKMITITNDTICSYTFSISLVIQIMTNTGENY